MPDLARQHEGRGGEAKTVVERPLTRQVLPGYAAKISSFALVQLRIPGPSFAEVRRIGTIFSADFSRRPTISSATSSFSPEAWSATWNTTTTNSWRAIKANL